MSSSSPDRALRASDVLSRDEIRALTESSNGWGAVAIAFSWLVIAATFAVLAIWPHPITFVIAVVVLGGRQLALAVMMHEAAHGTLFRSKWLNEKLADAVCAAPVWSDVARYRRHHLAHHAHTGTDRDPDLGLAPVDPMTRASLTRKILRDLSGASGLRRVVALLAIDLELIAFNVGGGVERQRWRGAVAHLRAGIRNLWKTVVATVVLVAVLSLAGITWTIWAWVVAYLTTFGLFLRVRSLAEHACMERTADPLRNTRSTRATLLARATVAPLHVNHHMEHHLLPTVPWYRLPALGRMLAARNVIPAGSRLPSYRAVLAAVSAPSAR